MTALGQAEVRYAAGFWPRKSLEEASLWDSASNSFWVMVDGKRLWEVPAIELTEAQHREAACLAIDMVCKAPAWWEWRKLGPDFQRMPLSMLLQSSDREPVHSAIKALEDSASQWNRWNPYSNVYAHVERLIRLDYAMLIELAKETCP